MDSYYGTATAAREAAQLWLFAAGSSKSPARVFDPILGYHYQTKGPDGTVMRWFFTPGSPGGVQRPNARR